MILVVMLDPFVKILFKIQKPKYVKEGSIPYVSWGYGSYPGNTKKSTALLAVGWGNVLTLINMDDKASGNKNFPVVAHYVF